MGRTYPPRHESRQQKRVLVPPPAPDDSTEPSTVCALCGMELAGETLQYRVVSPHTGLTPLTVCHVCRRAVLGEGYRPA